MTLFGQNLLETATVSATPAADPLALGRLYDRDRGPQFQAGNLRRLSGLFPITIGQTPPAEVDIDIDLGAPKPVSGWTLFNHNLAGVAVTLRADNTSPATTVRDTVTPDGTDFLRTFSSLTMRYWRVRIPAMAVPPVIGELLLGVPRLITDNPLAEQSAIEFVVNVGRDLSPAGHPWGYKRGERRVALPCAWDGLPEADRLAFLAALDDIGDGARNLAVVDLLGTVRWMTWLVGAGGRVATRLTGLGGETS